MVPVISFDHFIPEDGVPIYQQIVRHIKRGIVSGQIKSGDEVPSRRMLSALLGVNPNTIQKAFALLEGEGLMESRPGAKSYMVIPTDQAEKIREQLLEADARAIITSLKQMGLSMDQAISIIEKFWN